MPRYRMRRRAWMMFGRAILPAFLMLAVGIGRPMSEPDARFYELIRNNNLGGLEALIRQAGVDVRDERGATPLMHAAAIGSVEAMQLLLDAGADVNARNAFDATAL